MWGKKPGRARRSRIIGDEKSWSMLVLLDLSAEFNIIDINTLMRRLELTFGITGSALVWLRTYTWKPNLSSSKSEISSLACEFGIPRGSVLGTTLFATYIAPIAGVISSYGIHHAEYADDSQLYIELRDDNAPFTLNSCFQAFHRWFSEHFALNPDKSEVFVIGTYARNQKEGKIRVKTLCNTQISVKNSQEPWCHSRLNASSFNSYVDNMCKAAHFHIRSLRHIRRCIDEAMALTVASSMVGARIEYCNSVLHGTSAWNFWKLQWVINALARLVSGVRVSGDAIT